MKNKQIKNFAEPNDVITKIYFEKINSFEKREYKLKIPKYYLIYIPNTLAQ